MNWVTFKTAGGGLLKVQAKHVVAIYDELGVVKLSTVAGEVHTLADGTSVQIAAKIASDAEAGPLERRGDYAERWQAGTPG